MKLIVNVAGGRWPRPDQTIYKEFENADIPFEKAYQWTSQIHDPPTVVKLSDVLKKIDDTTGLYFPLERDPDLIPGEPSGMMHYDYEPPSPGGRYHLFRRAYSESLCDRWLDIGLGMIRHLNDGPAKLWTKMLWGFPMLPSSKGPVFASDDWLKTVTHLSPILRSMDRILISFYLRDTAATSGPMPIYTWTKDSFLLMEKCFAAKFIPTIWSHYSRGSGRNGQFLDWMDLRLQLEGFKAGSALESGAPKGGGEIMVWFKASTLVEAEWEARWIREVFIPTWNQVFGDSRIKIDVSEPSDPVEDEDLVGPDQIDNEINPIEEDSDPLD